MNNLKKILTIFHLVQNKKEISILQKIKNFQIQPLMTKTLIQFSLN